MATPKVLENFIVGLSMKGPSAADQRDAEKGFEGLSQAIAVAIPVITAAATSLVYATSKIASGLSKLYFEAQKIGTTPRILEALGFAAAQSGSSVEKLTSDLDKFATKLRSETGLKAMLADRLGLSPEELKDEESTYLATIKALAKLRNSGKTGDTEKLGAFRDYLNLDEDNILAAGRPEFDKYFKESYDRNKGLNEVAESGYHLTDSLNSLGSAVQAIGRALDAELFKEYGAGIDALTKWLDDNAASVVSGLRQVIDQFRLAWGDISIVAVPAAKAIGVALNTLSDGIALVLGSDKDGKPSGLRGIRAALDLLVVFVVAVLAKRLLALLGLRGIVGTVAGGVWSFGGGLLSGLGVAGVAAVAAVGAGVAAIGATVMPQPAGQGEDELYRQWHVKKHGKPPVDGAPKDPEFSAPGNPGAPGTPLDVIHGTTEGVDKDLIDSVTKGASRLPKGYKVEIFSGHRHGDSGAHGRGQAIDVQIRDPNGNVIRSRGEDTTGMYQLLAKHTYAAMKETHPEIAESKLAWGGSFGTQKGGGGEADLMHFDVMAKRGGVRPGYYPKIQDLGAAPKPPEAQKPSDPPPTPAGQSPLLDRKNREGVTEKYLKNMSFLSPKNLSRALAEVDSSRAPRKEQFARTNNIGSRKQVTNIHLASTDPQLSATEISRHMKSIHAGTLKSMDRLA